MRRKSATRVVFPEPALAVTSVTGRARFACRRPMSRGRESISGAGRGGKSFVRRKKQPGGANSDEFTDTAFVTLVRRDPLAIEMFPGLDTSKLWRRVAQAKA